VEAVMQAQTMMRTTTMAISAWLAMTSLAAAAPASSRAVARERAAVREADASRRASDAEDDLRDNANDAALADDAPLADDPSLAGAQAAETGVPTAVTGPPIRDVLSAAYAAAGLDRDPGRGWIRRARLAGLVPWLTVRTTYDTSWQDAHSEIGHGSGVEVRATWRLDRLVFDGKELQIASIEAARRRERQRLATRVIHAYFAWRGAAVTAPGASRARMAARVAEAAAELDVLTDGWFSDELARLRRGTARAEASHPVAP
jgi:hypothetical protein